MDTNIIIKEAKMSKLKCQMKNENLFTIHNSPSVTQSGAALLLTMLIIAVVGAMALAVSRIVLAELMVTSNYADSIVAYQAAESGIEQGLLKYRYNRSGESTMSKNLANDAKYNLNINFRANEAVFAGIIDGKQVNVKKDEAKKIDVSNLGSKSLTIVWEWGGNIGPPSDKGGLEIVLIKNNGTITRKLINIPTTTIASQDIPANSRILKIRPIGKWLMELKITVPSGEKIDTGIAKIESTGIYNRTKRKLVAEINRSSGTVLGIFDYTLYAGEGDITP